MSTETERAVARARREVEAWEAAKGPARPLGHKPNRAPSTVVLGPVRRDTPGADLRHAAAVILAAAGAENDRDGARDVAEAMGLIPTPEPKDPHRTQHDRAMGRTR